MVLVAVRLPSPPDRYDRRRHGPARKRPDAPDGLPVFWLDSQIAPVLDYLESKPENTDRVRRLVQQNKLRVGPWFIQGDEHLVDGEPACATCCSGRFYGADVRPAPAVGYVPDQFGHTAQLPQILRKAGIDNAVFWRAIVDQSQNRLTWRRPRWQRGARALAPGLLRQRHGTARGSLTAQRRQAQGSDRQGPPLQRRRHPAD